MSRIKNPEDDRHKKLSSKRHDSWYSIQWLQLEQGKIKKVLLKYLDLVIPYHRSWYQITYKLLSFFKYNKRY